MARIINKIDYSYIANAYKHEILDDVEDYFYMYAENYFDTCNDADITSEVIEDAFDTIYRDMAVMDEVCGNGCDGYPCIDAGRVAAALFQPEILKMAREYFGTEPSFLYSRCGAYYIDDMYRYVDCVVRELFYNEMRDEIHDIFVDYVRNFHASWSKN